MHIALNGWFWNQPATGSGQYIRYLVTALARLNPDCVFTVLLPAAPDHDVAISLPNLNLLSFSVPTSHIGKVWWEQIKVSKVACEIGADILHVPYWAVPVASPLAVVVTVHDLIPLILPAYRGGWRVRLYTALVRATTPRAALLLADSESTKQDIERCLHIASEKIHRVPLAVSDAYHPNPDSEDARLLSDLGIYPGYVLYVGGFDVRKNIKTLFAAFAQARPHIGDVGLVVGGKLPSQDSAFTPDPHRLVREAGLSEGVVRFLGFIPEEAKPALYRGARVFVFPSEYEGFGLPPLEALACGVPVVGSRTSSILEVVGDAGILTASTDVAGMARALVRLYQKGQFYQQMRQRACARARSFSWERTAHMTFSAYVAAARR